MIFILYTILHLQRDDIENTYRMNETDARRLCIKYIANSTIYKIADRPISAEPYIEDCVLDLMVGSDHTGCKLFIFFFLFFFQIDYLRFGVEICFI